MTVSQVREFHQACGTDDPLHPQVPDVEKALLRVRLIREETEEVAAAIENLALHDHGTLADLAKEIADLRYVVDGTILAFGLGDVIDEVCDRVHVSNMSKFHPKTGEPYRRADGKIMKGPYYVIPRFDDLFQEA